MAAVSYTRHVVVCLLVNIFGGLLFGYNTGVIAGAFGPMSETFPAFTSLKQGIFSTSILIGALIGSAYGGLLSEALKKQKTVVILSLFTIVGAIAISVIPYLWLMVFFREILGVGVGIASAVCPTFASENSPPTTSGLINASFQVAITLGILISYIINIIFQNVWGSYHWMFGLGCIPAIGLIFVTPLMDLPRLSDSLNIEGEDDDDNNPGESELLNSQDEGLEGEFLRKDRDNSYKNMFLSARSAVYTGIVLAVSLQLTGINAIMYYAPKIFAEMGLADNSLVATALIGAWNFLSTFAAIALVNKIPRRVLLLTSLCAITLSCFALGFVFQFLSGEKVGGILTLLLLFVFILAFEAGIGSLFWVVMTEIFPKRFKDKGASFINIVQWGLNILLSASFPSLIDLVGESVMFWFFSLIGLLSFVYLFFVYKKREHVIEYVSVGDIDYDQH